MSQRQSFVRYSTDNAVFAFDYIEDAIEALLAHNIPSDKTVEIYEGVFGDITSTDPHARRHLTVKVEVTSKLELLDYSVRGTMYAV